MTLTRNSTQADSYYQLARAGQVFAAVANVTAPVAYGTAAGIGGPLLWNNTGPGLAGGQRVMAVIIGLSLSWSTAPGAGRALGITWGSGQAAAPTSTTAIDGVACTLPGAAGPLCNTYRIGTVTNAGTSILITHSLSTAANTQITPAFVPLDGLIQVEPGGWAAVAGATLINTMVANISLVWAEVPF